MIKKITAYLLLMAVLLPACGFQKEGSRVLASAKAEVMESRETERGFDVEIGKEIGPLLSEKADTSKQGARTTLARGIFLRDDKGG